MQTPVRAAKGAQCVEYNRGSWRYSVRSGANPECWVNESGFASREEAQRAANVQVSNQNVERFRQRVMRGAV